MGSPAPLTLSADEVQVGTPNGPGLYLAEVGTPPPDTTTDDWDGWDLLGYISDDGPTVGQSTTSEALTPWQSVAPLKNVITAREVTLQFILWQINARTLALYFDADVPAEGAGGEIDMEVRTDQAGHVYAVGIDSRDGDRVLRIIFPRANLSDAGDMAISRGAVVPLDCTLSALETNGVLALVKLGPAEADDNGGSPMKASRNGTGAPNPRPADPPAPRRGRAVPDAPQAKAEAAA
jgi:hypothetical protein